MFFYLEIEYYTGLYKSLTLISTEIYEPFFRTDPR